MTQAESDLRDLYGTCKVKPCLCLQPGRVWLGRLCGNWTPMGPSNQEELAAWHRAASTEGRPPYRVPKTQED